MAIRLIYYVILLTKFDPLDTQWESYDELLNNVCEDTFDEIFATDDECKDIAGFYFFSIRRPRILGAFFMVQPFCQHCRICEKYGKLLCFK